MQLTFEKILHRHYYIPKCFNNREMKVLILVVKNINSASKQFALKCDSAVEYKILLEPSKAHDRINNKCY